MLSFTFFLSIILICYSFILHSVSSSLFTPIFLSVLFLFWLNLFFSPFILYSISPVTWMFVFTSFSSLQTLSPPPFLSSCPVLSFSHVTCPSLFTDRSRKTKDTFRSCGNNLDLLNVRTYIFELYTYMCLKCPYFLPSISLISSCSITPSLSFLTSDTFIISYSLLTFLLFLTERDHKRQSNVHHTVSLMQCLSYLLLALPCFASLWLLLSSPPSLFFLASFLSLLSPFFGLFSNPFYSFLFPIPFFYSLFFYSILFSPPFLSFILFYFFLLSLAILETYSVHQMSTASEFECRPSLRAMTFREAVLSFYERSQGNRCKYAIKHCCQICALHNMSCDVILRHALLHHVSLCRVASRYVVLRCNMKPLLFITVHDVWGISTPSFIHYSFLLSLSFSYFRSCASGGS